MFRLRSEQWCCAGAQYHFDRAIPLRSMPATGRRCRRSVGGRRGRDDGDDDSDGERGEESEQNSSVEDEDSNDDET